MSEKAQESKPRGLDDCVSALMALGHEEDRAYAICSAKNQKSANDTNIVRGYASIFGNIDRDGEIVDKGAFRAWLNSDRQKNIPYIWMHQIADLPVGTITALKEDEKGLYYEAEILDTEAGRDLIKAIRAGAVKSASFSYDIIDSYNDLDEIQHLSQLNLLEISAVTTGMASNPKAYVEIFEKPDEPGDDNASLSADEFKAVMRQFVNNLEAERNE